ncbi:MAG: Rnase Y domain-containing protein, partial [candidate division NC10 bacterium]
MPVVMDLTLLWVALGLAGGAAAGYALRVYLSRKRIAEAEADAARILREAEKEAESKRREAELEIRDRMLQARTELERETRDQRNELQGLERRLLQREELLNRQIEILDRRDKEMQARLQSLQQREAAVDESEQRLRALLEEQRRALERVAGMTTEEAKRALLKDLEEEARLEAAALAKRIEEEAKETAEQKAKEILAVAVDRCSTDFVAEATVSVVDLPSDDMKGRIIGREGRNIRAFEKATGIDVIVDDTPEAVILSGFDSVRREVARIALQRLIVDGRIHPARIEEVVEKVKKEIEEDIKQAGEQALFEVGVTGMHPELTRLIGRLKYRTSYSQ